MPVDETTDIDLGTSEKTFAELDHAASKAIHVLEQRNRELKTSIGNAAKAKSETDRLDKRGGIFSKYDEVIKSGKAPQDLKAQTKNEKTIEKNFKKLEEKIKKQEIKNNSQKEFEREQKRGGIFAELSNVPNGKGAPVDIKRDIKKLDEIIDSKTKQATDKLKSEIFGDEIGFETVTNLIAFGKNPTAFMSKTMKSFKSVFIPLIAVFAAAEITRQILDEVKKIDIYLKKFFDRVNERLDTFNTLDEQASIRAGLTQRIVTTASGSKEPRYSYNTFDEFNNNRVEHEANFQLNNNSGV